MNQPKRFTGRSPAKKCRGDGAGDKPEGSGVSSFSCTPDNWRCCICTSRSCNFSAAASTPEPAGWTLEMQLRKASVSPTFGAQVAYEPMLSGELRPNRSPISITTRRAPRDSATSSATATRPSRTRATGATGAQRRRLGHPVFQITKPTVLLPTV